MRDKSGLALALSNIINSFYSDSVSAGRSGVKTTFVPPLTPVRGSILRLGSQGGSGAGTEVW